MWRGCSASQRMSCHAFPPFLTRHLPVDQHQARMGWPPRVYRTSGKATDFWVKLTDQAKDEILELGLMESPQELSLVSDFTYKLDPSLATMWFFFFPPVARTIKQLQQKLEWRVKQNQAKAYGTNRKKGKEIKTMFICHLYSNLDT